MKVKILPQNIELEIAPNQTVMDLCHKNNIPIKSVCNGLPSCAECRVKLVEGEFNVLPPNHKELNLIGTGHFIDQRRLSCQMICFGDIVIDTTEQLDKSASTDQKRPQGNLRKEDSEESYAVVGSILEQDQNLVKEIMVEPEKNESHQPRRHGHNRPRRRPRGGRHRFNS